jgi:hypothetical protein
VEQGLVTSYDQWWTVRLKNVLLNDVGIHKAAGAFAIVDTGTSLLYMQETDYSYFTAMIMAASPDFNCSSLLYDYCFTEANTCDAYWSKMEPLTLVLDANEYVIMPQGYTLSNGDLDGHLCAIAVSYSSDIMGIYILGDTFLRNFVSSYDYKRKTLGLAVNINAPAGTQAIAHMGTFSIVWIVIGVIAFLLVSFWGFSMYKKKQRARK